MDTSFDPAAWSWLQWPAAVASLLAAWMVASNRQGRRHAGFWVFLASNVLWVVWGTITAAWALVALQVGLAIMNVRGERKTQQGDGSREPAGRSASAVIEDLELASHRPGEPDPARETGVRVP